MRKRLLTNATLGLIAVAISTASVEMALRFLYPASERHFVLLPNETTVFTPLSEHIHGVSGEAVYRTSSEGIRGPEFGDGGEFRILMIGGSTTQNAYLDQSETWTLQAGELLNERGILPVWTGDVGRSGHTARSHVLQFEALVPELPRIDMVVMLVGVNDLTTALRQGFDFVPDPPLTDPRARAEQMRQAFLMVPGRLHDRSTNYLGEEVPAYKRTALYQLARAGRDAIRQMRGGTRQDRVGESYSTWRSHRATASVVHDSLPDLRLALQEYKGYLEEIAAFAEAHDVRLLFMTQPTLWRHDLTPEEESLLWLGGIGDFQEQPGLEYFSAGVLADAMAAYNATLLSVCDARPAECLDVAAALPKDTSVFYDDVHFTEHGSDMVAELLADYIASRPPFTDSDDPDLAVRPPS